MLIKMVFIGEDGSMGYKHLQEYKLIVALAPIDGDGYPIYITKAGESTNWCPYSSLDAFFENWAIPEDSPLIIRQYRKCLE